ncbi:hypothetical protein FGG08_007231 [Glutinoglossum americanum]|uniref:Polyphosphate kinase-2-related domain-containing protein n=1 Tax=Glutinoglossum americanum TaxID=1670608 RepID=A0A9P8HUF2_9PEZI|nr:hypothetical protein FGG08_007231 [Glutinoglossum americanum]
MKMDVEKYSVQPGKKIALKNWPTKGKPLYDSKKDFEKRLDEYVEELIELQQLHYAATGPALLLIFQGMDASGKDGVVKHVMSGINPQGFQVYSFKQPSEEERKHDFLWRTTRCLPERGRIGIFNRSYYEEVLVVKVHPEFLLGQGLTEKQDDGTSIWKNRYESIVNFEEHLSRNGTRVVKFFLHLSKDEQRKQFLERIDDPAKNWKFNPADVQERALWDQYQEAYEDCLSATSTKNAPWYIIPADDRYNARLIVARVVLDLMKSLKLEYPQTTEKRREELQAIRKLL